MDLVKIINDLINVADPQKQQAEFTSILRNKLEEKLYIPMEQDILSLAWRISPVIWYETKKTIKFIKIEKPKEAEKFIDEMVEKIKSQFKN